MEMAETASLVWQTLGDQIFGLEKAKIINDGICLQL
jgi:hypothetical protein